VPSCPETVPGALSSPGYHSYDRDVGLRDRVFSPLRWSGAVLSAAERVASQLNLTRGDYVAALIRVGQ